MRISTLLSARAVSQGRGALLTAVGLAAFSLLLLAGRSFGNSPAARADDAPLLSPTAKGVLVLFSGKEEEIAKNWTHGGGKDATWKFVDGAMQARNGSIVSKETFKDCQLHVEFRVPFMPDAKGQGRGNSGIGLQSRYEVQVLDSFGKAEPGTGDCGAIYNVAAPLFNACKKPLEWQTYDILFRAPRYDAAGKKIENARITVFQNGMLIQNNVEVTKGTGIGQEPPTEQPGPINLQDHSNPVEYRNVWVLPLPASGAKKYE